MSLFVLKGESHNPVRVLDTPKLANKDFNGIDYTTVVSNQMFSTSCGRFLLFASHNQEILSLFALDLAQCDFDSPQWSSIQMDDSDSPKSKALVNLSKCLSFMGGSKQILADYSIRILDYFGGLLLLELSNQISPPRMVLLDLEGSQILEQIFEKEKSQEPVECLEIIYELPNAGISKILKNAQKFSFSLNNDENNQSVFGYLPESKKEKVPFICYLHGGPFAGGPDKYE